MTNNYTFILPLLNTKQAWGAAEVNTWPTGSSTAAKAATMGLDTPMLINMSTETLTDAFVGEFPCGKAIFSLPAAAFGDASLIEKMVAWRQQGHFFAVRDAIDSSGSIDINKLPAVTDYLSLPAGPTHDRLPSPVLAQLVGTGIKLIATEVRNEELFVWAVAKGFSLFSSEFVVMQDDLPASGTDPSKLKLLKLLSLVVQDADTRELEEIFKQEPKLSYNLMRLVNSVSMGGGQTHISNFGQAITLLGRRQLQRWLQLLIYANQFGNAEPNPLMLQAALRGRLLDELTAHLPALSEHHDYGFMTGIFSLLDIQLSMRMDDIVTALPLTDEVRMALTGHQGVFGELLSAIEKIEQKEFAAAVAIMERHGISPDIYWAAQESSLNWVSHLNLE